MYLLLTLKFSFLLQDQVTLADFGYHVLGLWFYCPQRFYNYLAYRYFDLWRLFQKHFLPTKFDIYVLLRSLFRYLCWWIISPRVYHPPSSQCFADNNLFPLNYIKSNYMQYMIHERPMFKGELHSKYFTF